LNGKPYALRFARAAQRGEAAKKPDYAPLLTLHPMAPGVSGSGRHHGLILASGALMARIQYAGHELLRRCLAESDRTPPDVVSTKSLSSTYGAA
jgi:hypothetical protein